MAEGTIKRGATQLSLRARHPVTYRLFSKYRRYTLVNRARFLDNLKLVRATTVAGDIVECGTYRGGMSAAMAEALPGRRSVLLDSFQGLPRPTDVDGKKAFDFIRAEQLVASKEDVESLMATASDNYSIRPGWFEETVPVFAAEHPTIAVLRLDGDWYDSTMVCLQHLFGLVPAGGLVIIDDYDSWPGCSRAVHDFLSREESDQAIRGTESGVAYVRRVAYP